MGTSRKRPLSEKEEAFVEYFARSWNAADAARRAGYEGDGRQQGYRLSTNVDILKAVKVRADSLRMSTEEHYALLEAQARGDIGDLIEDDGRINIKKAREESKLRLVSEYQEDTTIRPTPDGETITVKKKVKLYSAQKALDMLSPDKAALLESRVALLQNKLEELQKKEVLLAFLKQKAAPDIYQEVLRLLSGGAKASSISGGLPPIKLEWEDARSPDPADRGSDDVPSSDGDSEPSGEV